MKVIYRSTILLIVFSIMSVQAQPLKNRGLLPIRNQFPVSLQFLSFTAEDAQTAVKGKFNFSLSYDHSNTFAMSQGALQTISGNEGRFEYQPLSANEKYYLIDTGTGRFNLDLHYGLSENVTIGINLPFIIYQGGVLDTPIEIFHNTFGIDNYSRSILKTNKSQLYLNSDQSNYNSQLGYGMGDIAISAKMIFYRSSRKDFNVSMLGVIKLPTGDFEKFSGSGSFDYGINLISTNSWNQHHVTNNFGVVFPGPWKLFPDLRSHNIFNWMMGYEYYMNTIWSFIFQHRILTSPLNQGIYSELAKPSFEWSAGAKVDLLRGIRLSLGITQNYINHENVPDFGIHIGIQTIL